MDLISVQTKVWLLAAMSVLFAFFATVPAHAGEGMMERVSIDADIGTVTTVAGGKVSLGPFSVQIGARETQTDAAVADIANGSAKDVSIKLKLRDSTNVGSKQRLASVYGGR